MVDPQGPEAEPRTEPAETLRRTYDGLLERQAWEADAPPSPETPPPAGTPDRSAAPPPLVRIVEALLFVGGPPLTAVRVCEVIRGLTETQFTEVINTLNEEYRREGRPYLIQAQDQGQVLALRPRFHPVREKLYGGPREARLSPAAVDVLALVAYRQPATKQEVDTLRGAESGALLRQLVRRGLVAVVNRGDAAGRAVSYGTTPRFLQLFGLRSLEDLPQTQELQRL